MDEILFLVHQATLSPILTATLTRLPNPNPSLNPTVRLLSMAQPEVTQSESSTPAKQCRPSRPVAAALTLTGQKSCPMLVAYKRRARDGLDVRRSRCRWQRVIMSVTPALRDLATCRKAVLTTVQLAQERMALREKELRAAKAQLQRRDGNAARAAQAEAALAAAKAEVRDAL